MWRILGVTRLHSVRSDELLLRTALEDVDVVVDRRWLACDVPTMSTVRLPGWR